METMTARIGATLLGSLLSAAIATAQPVVVLDPTVGDRPEGVAVEKSGDIWVSVQPTCEVRRYTPKGEEVFRLQLVTPAEGCLAGNGLAVGANGTLFAAVFSWNPDTNGVYIVDRRGTARHVPGSGQIVYPNAIALDDGLGTAYVTDMIGGAVWRIGRDDSVERWAWGPALQGNLPLPPGFPQGNPLGANGIALRHEAVYVAVTFAPRIVWSHRRAENMFVQPASSSVGSRA